MFIICSQPFPQVSLTFSACFSKIFPPGVPNILQFFPSVSNLFPRFSLGFPYIFQLFPTFSLHFPPPLAPNRPPTARTLASSANLVKARRLKPPKAPWRCAVSITWGDGEKWWFHGNYHLKKLTFYGDFMGFHGQPRWFNGILMWSYGILMWGIVFPHLLGEGC